MDHSNRLLRLTMVTGKKKKLATVYTTHPNLKYKSLKDYQACKPVSMLQSRTKPTTIYKVKAHVNIIGNEQADKLAKAGT